MENPTKLLVIACLAIVLFGARTATASWNGGESEVIGPHQQFWPKSTGEFLHRVGQQWIPVKGQKWHDVEVAFTAHSDGHLTNLRIDKTSKCKAVDNMALRAVIKAAPLNVIANKARSAVEVELLFVNADVSEPEYPEEIPNEQLLETDSKPDIELGPYITALEPQLSRNWRPPAWNTHDFPTGAISCSADGGGKGYNFCQSVNARSTVISFRVNRSGQFSQIKVKESCGDAATDMAALNAVQRAASGPALPNGAPESIDLEWYFSETDKLYLHIIVP